MYDTYDRRHPMLPFDWHAPKISDETKKTKVGSFHSKTCHGRCLQLADTFFTYWYGLVRTIFNIQNSADYCSVRRTSLLFCPARCTRTLGPSSCTATATAKPMVRASPRAWATTCDGDTRYAAKSLVVTGAMPRSTWYARLGLAIVTNHIRCRRLVLDCFFYYYLSINSAAASTSTSTTNHIRWRRLVLDYFYCQYYY